MYVALTDYVYLSLLKDSDLPARVRTGPDAAANTHLGLGGVLLLDDGPLLSVQAVSQLELLHEDVPVAVLPSLDHDAAHHLVLAQIHLEGRERERESNRVLE